MAPVVHVLCTFFGWQGSRSSSGGIPDILVDDTATLWQQTVRFLRQARVDLVLDNAGTRVW